MKKRPQYDEEFKRNSVELYHSSNRGIPQLARELGIAPETLRRWAMKELGVSGLRKKESQAATSHLRQQLPARVSPIHTAEMKRIPGYSTCSPRCLPPYGNMYSKMCTGLTWWKST